MIDHVTDVHRLLELSIAVLIDAHSQAVYRSLNVHTKAHFVLATGQTTVGTTDTYHINDPGYNRSMLVDYNNTHNGLRLYKTSNTPPSALYVIVHSPAEILVTDPNGKKTGLIH